MTQPTSAAQKVGSMDELISKLWRRVEGLKLVSTLGLTNFGKFCIDDAIGLMSEAATVLEARATRESEDV